jgi:hypothetical protein
MAKPDPRHKQPAAPPSPAADNTGVQRAVKPARMPKASAAPPVAETKADPDEPLSSRTTTVDDPMTTSLLAEASRHRSTIEISPDELEKAIAAGAAEHDADAAEHDPPDDST